MSAIVRSSGPAEGLRARAARSEELARSAGSAREPLLLVARLFEAEARALRTLQRAHGQQRFGGTLQQDAERALPALFELLGELAAHAPEALAEEARARAAEDAGTALVRLELAWGGEPASAKDQLSRAMLRPYLELLRAEGCLPPRVHAIGRCPFCGGPPAVGCLRGGGADGGEGSARSLVCGLCGLEWAFARIACPVCAEADPARLPVFRADAHPGARLDACESCRAYVKTLDLSRDARAIAEVDELASWALDLWADEQGWRRSAPGLAGV